MTAGELAEALAAVDPDTEVRLATQPAWPLQYGVDGVVAIKAPGGEAGIVVYLGEGAPPSDDESPYVPQEVADTLGWSDSHSVRDDCSRCGVAISLQPEHSRPVACSACGGDGGVILVEPRTEWA